MCTFVLIAVAVFANTREFVKLTLNNDAKVDTVRKFRTVTGFLWCYTIFLSPFSRCIHSFMHNHILKEEKKVIPKRWSKDHIWGELSTNWTEHQFPDLRKNRFENHIFNHKRNKWRQQQQQLHLHWMGWMAADEEKKKK